ncbi:MAG: hypothetical protein ABSG25_15465, partial [Bryobacteraceae bacterium]
MGAAQSPNATPNGTTTNYAYDGLNNLTGVNMAGQTRSFTYSSLSRLLSSNNPESGAINYSYDSNGNLLTKTDARGIATSFGTVSGTTCSASAQAYDGLNRPGCKTYSDGTPAVLYTYDHSGDTKGTLYKVATSVGNGTTYTHDKFGRVTGSTQTTGGTTYPPFSYSYSLTDKLTQIVYPSGLTTNYNLDNDDRVTSVTGMDAGKPTTYAALSYLAPGQISTELLGNGVLEN